MRIPKPHFRSAARRHIFLRFSYSVLVSRPRFGGSWLRERERFVSVCPLPAPCSTAPLLTPPVSSADAADSSQALRPTWPVHPSRRPEPLEHPSPLSYRMPPDSEKDLSPLPSSPLQPVSGTFPRTRPSEFLLPATKPSTPRS